MKVKGQIKLWVMAIFIVVMYVRQKVVLLIGYMHICTFRTYARLGHISSRANNLHCEI